jgi:hypothetical protein
MTDIGNPMEYYLKIPSVKFVSETVKDRGNPLIFIELLMGHEKKMLFHF